MTRKKPSDVETIGVIGAGTIGASWAAYFMAQGRHVQAWDPAEDAAEKLKSMIAGAWPVLNDLGLVVEGADQDNLTFCETPEQTATGADFIQESAPERLEIKREIYDRFEKALEPDVIVSTSTSGLLMSDLQQGRLHPERFVLGHPFNPPHLIPLVEVLGGEKTDPAVVDWTVDFYNAIGKRAIRLNKEVPGHVANRLQAAIWRESIHLAAEGVASMDDIDAAIAYGPGIRWALMGPHLTFHLAGGPGGTRNFVEHLGPAVASWWEDLGTPELTDEMKQMLVEGIEDVTKGKSVAELVKSRDDRLLPLLKTLRDSDKD